MRTRTLLLSVVVVTVVPVWLASLAAGGSPPGQQPPSPMSVVRSTRAGTALAVLRQWDRRRAAAWRHADAAALAELYTRRSRAGQHDVSDLERWRRRGLRVVGLRQQVRAVHVARAAGRRLVVVVTDRTVDGVAVGAGRRTSVPQSAWATHRISLRHTGSGWRVVEASLSAPGRARR